MPTMRRAKLENGQIILVRDVFSRDGRTYALISKKRQYGIWNINDSKWYVGPFKKQRAARAHWDYLLLEAFQPEDH
jgi:hypothetical protein